LNQKKRFLNIYTDLKKYGREYMTEKKIPKKQFLFLMTRLATAFREDISPDLFELYYEFLGNVEVQKLKECIDNLIRDKKWFPKIAEFEEFLYPKRSHESEYIAYLERSTENNLREIKQLEDKRNRLSTEEASEWIKKIYERVDPDQYSPTLQGNRAEEFEEKRKIAKKKIKQVLLN
jgi:hypothetical protein